MMDALDAFTTYLAQAHGCRAVAAHSLRPDGAPAYAGLQASDLAHALPTFRLEAPGASSGGERLGRVREALETAPAAVVIFESATPRPDAVDGARRALDEQRLTPAFVGRVRDPVAGRDSIAAVLEGKGAPRAPDEGPPAEFRVVAIVPTYNEEDLIAQTLRDIVAQGAEAYLVDNGSTDGTLERARPFLGRGLLAIERFPPDGVARTYDLRALLERIEVIAEGLGPAPWVVLHDADERRRSPWQGVSLRDALWRAERSGFTCVDHVTLEFWPTGEGFDPEGPDVEEQLRHFEFSRHPGHFHQRRAWKQAGRRVALARSAGHDVDFPGRRVYPYKFLLKHYPLRSQAHGERKLLDRRRRWNAEERAAGWHRQYDDLTPRSFVRDPSTLRWFDPATFHEEFLVERLSGAGVFDAPPAWATPPRW